LKYDIIVIGGGIVGLASALQLTENHPEIRLLLLEKESKLAQHQTGNNSGVIHSGIYYKPNSLKARNCIHGYNLLLEFCQKHDVPFDICGKIIVATSQEELPALNRIFERGRQNQLEGIRKITAEEMREYEPHVAGIEGIHVPQTGIVDYRKVAEKYAELLRKREVEIRTNEKVIQLKTSNRQAEVITENETFTSKLVVNCAGLYSDKMAQFTQPELNVKIIPFRGEYYKLHKDKEYLVKNLIYPVPDANFPFLGVHFTRMARGGVEAGPNAVFAFKREGYSKTDFNFAEFSEAITWRGFQKVALKYWKTGLGEYYRSFSKSAFTKALQKLIPEIQQDDLVMGGAGIRAQACDHEGGLIDDFLILEDEASVHVCNAPSPAATSSLAIGETIGQKMAQRLENL